MMGVIEAVRMMMIRIPSQVGAAIALLSGITLVIAGLYANFINAGVVIIATLSMISSFGLPSFDLRISIRIIQFFTMLMTTVLGIFGFALAFFMITVHFGYLKIVWNTLHSTPCPPGIKRLGSYHPAGKHRANASGRNV